MTRGVVPHDEGYILHSANKILEGKMPYRDFNFVYTPLSIYATAISFLILQPSVLSSRILMIIIAVISSLLVFKIIILATRNKLYATIAVVIFIAWGPTHINFAWPVMFAILTSLTTIYLMFKFLATRQERYLYLSGISAFTIFLAKQNFGLSFLMPVLAFLLVKNMRNIRYYISFSYGYIWGIIIFCIYLLMNQSFAPFIWDFYDYTIKRIIIGERLSTDFIYKDSLSNMVLRTTFYLSPLLISAASFIILIIRRRFHLLFVPVFVTAFYIVGIRPTTDYVHLTPLLSLLGLPVALFLRYNISSYLRLLFFLFSILIIVLGFHTALIKGYYKRDNLLTQHNSFYNHPRVNVFINEKSKLAFNGLIDVTNIYTNKNDYIFVNSYNPMVYFVTQRREPINGNFLLTEIDHTKYYDEVLGNLVAKDVKLLILDKNSTEQLPINDFIQKNYYYMQTIIDFDIYIKKP